MPKWAIIIRIYNYELKWNKFSFCYMSEQQFLFRFWSYLLILFHLFFQFAAQLISIELEIFFKCIIIEMVMIFVLQTWYEPTVSLQNQKQTKNEIPFFLTKTSYTIGRSRNLKVVRVSHHLHIEKLAIRRSKLEVH